MDIRKMRLNAVKSRLSELKNDTVHQTEMSHSSMNFGDASMKYFYSVIGDEPDDGYPVYIALHGGGGAPTPDMNNSQWEHMKIYYRKSLEALSERTGASGIYIAPRGIRDTWDTHANPESYPLYLRLITNFAADFNVNMNRIYIIGFSAGGDGVYLITSKLADKFAAANMSAGHPNGIDMTNIRNMPIMLQVGENDTAYKRNTITAEYDKKLKALSETYGGFIHNTFIHKGKPHNFKDNDYDFENHEVYKNTSDWLENGDNSETVMTDTNALSFLNKFTRNPIPERVVYNLSSKPPMCEEKSNFYWLGYDKDADSGIIDISIIKSENKIIVNKNTANGKIHVLVNEEMFDFSQPVTIINGDTEYSVNLLLNEDIIKETAKSADIYHTFAAKAEIL